MPRCAAQRNILMRDHATRRVIIRRYQRLRRLLLPLPERRRHYATIRHAAIDVIFRRHTCRWRCLLLLPPRLARRHTRGYMPADAASAVFARQPPLDYATPRDTRAMLRAPF